VTASGAFPYMEQPASTGTCYKETLAKGINPSISRPETSEHTAKLLENEDLTEDGY